MKDLDRSSFFNNKELFTKWFCTPELDKELVARCRQLMNEDIFHLNWRTSIGVTLDWEYVKNNLKGAHIVKDFGRYKSVFLDFLESRLPAGRENKPENYCVIVFNESVNNVFTIPHRAIMSYWSAGWPRHGWNPGRYVTEPWEILKPLHDYLNGSISYIKLNEATQYKKYYCSQEAIKYVYETIYPLIQSKRFMTSEAYGSWVSVLGEYYSKAVGINKTQFKSVYNPKNRFTGPLERTFSFSRFDDPKEMKNPFLRYYKELRDEYLKSKE